MRIKSIGKIAGLAMVMAGLSANAAFVINYPIPDGNGTPDSDATLLKWIDKPANQEQSDLESELGYAPGTLGSILYKNDNGTESGSLSGSYVTTPSPWNAGSSEPIKIKFDGTVFASPATVFVIKDGILGTLVFSLAGWDGQDEIHLYNVFNFDPPGPRDPKTDLSGTSHFEFYGTGTEEIIPVPEPTTVVAGTLLLLPLGASAVRILRKNRAA